MERALTIRSSRARFAVSVVTGPHRAARLNSGVSPAEKDHLQRAQQELPCSTLARAPAYLGPDTPPRGEAFLGYKAKPDFRVIGNNSRLQ